MSIDKEKEFQISKTVYGPVQSWRFGNSLGIDLLYHTSICSFNCIYCQLGHIQNITDEIKVYVETNQVIKDFKEVIKTNPTPIDVIMFSGNGEPTLAKNLGEVNKELKKLSPNSKTAILTNAVHLGDPAVQNNLKEIDLVIIKLDAPNNRLLQMMNRPHSSVTFEKIMEGIKSFKKNYNGEINVQTMFMPLNSKETEELAKHLVEIDPTEIQLNTPKRQYPLEWYRENRGNHKDLHDHDTRKLKTLDQQMAKDVEQQLRQLTGLKINSIYR